MLVPGTIIKPKYVALDSAHLAAVLADMGNDNAGRRAKAAAFMRMFEGGGNVLLLTWHHLQELLSHENESVVAARLATLASMRMVASIISLTEPSLPGSIIDIEALEVRAIYENAGATMTDVRAAAAAGLFKLVAGRDLIRPFLEARTLLAQTFADQAARHREVVAISRSDFARVSDLKVVDLLKQPVRTYDDALRQLTNLDARLAADIRRRGDRRIASAAHASHEFMQGVANLGRDLGRDQNPTLDILRLMGLDLSDIGPDTTVGDVGRLATFRKRLEVINRSLGLPWGELKARVTAERVPSHLIRGALDRFRPETSEWKGSDLPDSYLACLAAYADVTYVDKRTHEALRLAKQKVPAIASLLRRVEKAGNYAAIPSQLLNID